MVFNHSLQEREYVINKYATVYNTWYTISVHLSKYTHKKKKN